jgi:hypothetical protein
MNLAIFVINLHLALAMGPTPYGGCHFTSCIMISERIEGTCFELVNDHTNVELIN